MNRKRGAFLSVFLSAALLFTSGCSLGIEKVSSQSSASSSGISSASVSSFDMATKVMETDKYRFELPESWDKTIVSGKDFYMPKDTDLAEGLSGINIDMTPGEKVKLTVNQCKALVLPELRKSISAEFPNAQDFIFFDYKCSNGPVFVASSKVEKGLILSFYCLLDNEDSIMVTAMDFGNAGKIRLHDVAKHVLETIQAK